MTQVLASHPIVQSLDFLKHFEGPLASLKEKAWRRFEQLGLPSLKDEAYSYMKLGGLYQKELEPLSASRPDENLIEAATKPFKKSSYLLFYNGSFLPRYSNFEAIEDDLVILPMSEAITTYSVFLDHYFETLLESEKDPFALLSIAMQQEGLFVYVPKNVHCEQEVHVIEVYDAQKSHFLAPFTLISCGQNASLKLTTSSFGKTSQDPVVSSFYGFMSDKDSYVQHTHLSSQSNSFRFEAFRSMQKKGSHFIQVQGCDSSYKTRTSYHHHLQEEGIQTEIIGLLALKEKEEAHIHILLEHHAPNCYSRQLVKTLLKGESVASFEGKIKVDPIAQQTNAYQLNQNCLLSEKAQVNSKPNLEIFADDVKASHGSTTGQIDQEQLFYLCSRGLTRKEAEKLLLKGFSDEVIQEMPSKIGQDLFSKHIQHFFEVV